jgi:hypothetical protein
LYQAFTKANTNTPGRCAALEFGTLPIDQVLPAMQGDNWLHCFASRQHPFSPWIRRLMKDAFSVPEQSQDEVVSSAIETIGSTSWI